MPSALRCPRCRSQVQAHWTRCPACGFEPPGAASRPGATGSTRRTVPTDAVATPATAPGADVGGATASASDGGVRSSTTTPAEEAFDPSALIDRVDPDLARRRAVDGHDDDVEGDARVHTMVVVALAVTAGLLIGAVVAGILFDAGGSGGGSASGPVALGRTAEDRTTTDLGDGWWRLELDDGALAVDLPGPLLRTRDDVGLDGAPASMPAAVWAAGTGTEEITGIVVAEPPGGGDPEELLERIVLQVGDQEVGGPGVATEVAGRPALRRFQGGGGRTTATTSVATADEVVIIVVRTDPAVLEDVLGRIEGSLLLG